MPTRLLLGHLPNRGGVVLQVSERSCSGIEVRSCLFWNLFLDGDAEWLQVAWLNGPALQPIGGKLQAKLDGEASK